MGQHTRITTAAARIVVDEVCLVLRDQPGFKGDLHLWIHNLREWPGKVVPDTDDHIRAAVDTLISRAEWPRTELRDLTRVLTRLYEAGWCNDAIIHLLDRDPDGSRVAPFNNGKDKVSSGLVAYVHRRLNRWRTAEPHGSATDDYVPPNPVERAVPFTDWAHRMQAVHGDILRREPKPVTERAHAAYGRNHRHRDAPVDRAKHHGKRRAGAMDMLAVITLLEDDARRRRARPPGNPFLTQSDRLPPGDPLVLLLDPDVHQALREFAAADERTRRHSHALRTAVAHAKRAGTLNRTITYPQAAELAATITRADGTPVPQTTIRYLLERAL